MITPSFSLTATERVLPKLALDFTTASLDSRITFTRTTDATHPATYVNSSGLVTAATNNQPRFDYDPVTLVCKGLLIEESRTNLLVQSGDISAAWTGTRATIDASVVVAPDGTTMQKLTTDTSTANSHLMTMTNTVAFTAGQPYTFSMHFAAGEYSWARIRFNTTGGVFASDDVYFNISTGTIGTTDADITASIKDCGGGVYRCIATRTALATASGSIQVAIAEANNDVSFDGDGTSGIYVWGAQLEAGAFATSYIPTTTTSLTRNADVAVMTGTNFSDWYNDTAGTFLVDATGFASTFAATRYFLDADNKMSIGYNPAYRGGPTALITIAGTNAVNVASKMAVAGNASGYALTYNGNTPSTNATALQLGATQLRLGAIQAGTAASIANMHIRQMMYWPQRLTNAELQAITK